MQLVAVLNRRPLPNYNGFETPRGLDSPVRFLYKVVYEEARDLWNPWSTPLNLRPLLANDIAKVSYFGPQGRPK